MPDRPDILDQELRALARRTFDDAVVVRRRRGRLVAPARRRWPSTVTVMAVTAISIAAVLATVWVHQQNVGQAPAGAERHGGGSSTSPGGGSAGPTAPADPCRGAAACLIIGARITGPEVLGGEQRRPLDSCGALLSVDSEGALAPRLQGSLGGRQVSTFLKLPSAAPGTYQYLGSPSYPEDLLDIDDRHYVSAIGGSAQLAAGTAVIAADGSGSYRITGLMNQVRPTELVSLEVSWQCVIQ